MGSQRRLNARSSLELPERTLSELEAESHLVQSSRWHFWGRGLLEGESGALMQQQQQQAFRINAGLQVSSQSS
jgi:hypothetical protein